MTSTTFLPPLRAVIIGLGGFAQTHHNTMRILEGSGQARLVATCDPNPDAFKEKMEEWEFKKRGVQVFNDYRMMLMSCQQEIDYVVIPTPIPLHAEMHAFCVELGLAVYLEKPPTLDAEELESMIRTDAKAVKATNVGFNFTVETERRELKKRILSGEFGKVQTISLSAIWPRTPEYYGRAGWAGKLMTGNQLVLDSPVGNAMAHMVYNLFFWGGQNGVLSWADLLELRAELYRARSIEGADTFFIEARSPENILFRFALTHAANGPQTHEETVECEKAVIHYRVYEGYEVVWRDGRREADKCVKSELHPKNLISWLSYLRGEEDRPLNRLVDARSFVALNGLAYVSAEHIQKIPAELLETFVPVDAKMPPREDWPVIRNVRDWTKPFLEKGVWPSDTYPWAKKGKSITPQDLPKLKSVVQKMRDGVAE